MRRAVALSIICSMAFRRDERQKWAGSSLCSRVGILINSSELNLTNLSGS